MFISRKQACSRKQLHPQKAPNKGRQGGQELEMRESKRHICHQKGTWESPELASSTKLLPDTHQVKGSRRTWGNELGNSGDTPCS